MGFLASDLEGLSGCLSNEAVEFRNLRTLCERVGCLKKGLAPELVEPCTSRTARIPRGLVIREAGLFFRKPDAALRLPNTLTRWQPDTRPERRLGSQHPFQVGLPVWGRQAGLGESRHRAPRLNWVLGFFCRTEEEFDYGFDDEPTPSPQGYGATPNPQTPGYPDPSSPQVNPPYNPQTPGTPAM